jgi:hypothetical protein
VPALHLMLDVYDFEVEEQFDWPALLASRPDVPRRVVSDYYTGNRVTLLCRRRSEPGPGGSAEDGSQEARA